MTTGTLLLNRFPLVVIETRNDAGCVIEMARRRLFVLRGSWQRTSPKETNSASVK